MSGISKFCPRCKTNTFNFSPNLARHDGLSVYCKSCSREYGRELYKRNPEKWKAYQDRTKEQRKLYRKKYYKKNRHEIRRKRREYYLANREKIITRVTKHYENNKEKVLATKKKRYPGYYKIYRKQFYLNYLKRKNIIKRATPIWADLDGIMFFYIMCPPGHEVDHIYPLQGKNVCGLHLLENLQYLPKELNRSKGNKHNV
jgi:hypothetical protein